MLLLLFLISRAFTESNVARPPCLDWKNNQSILLSNYGGNLTDVTQDSLWNELMYKYSQDEFRVYCIQNNTDRLLTSGLVLGNWFIHEVTVYHFQDHVLIDSSYTGSQVPNLSKALSVGYHQIVPLNFQPNSMSQVLIIYKSHRGFPTEGLPVIMPLDNLLSHVLIHRGLISFALGILFLMLFYGVVLYVKMQASLYLYYNLYLVGVIVNLLAWSGRFGPLLGENLTLQIPLMQIVIIGSWICYILFLVQLLSESNRLNGIRRLRIFFIIIGVGMYALCNYFYFVEHNLLISSWLFLVQGTLFALVVIYVSIQLFRESTTSVKYFFYGSVFLSSGILLNIFFSLFFNHENTSLILDPNLLIPLAIVLEISCFTVGLSVMFKNQEVGNAIQRKRIQELLEQKTFLLKNDRKEYARESVFSGTKNSPFVQRCIETINLNLGSSGFTVAEFASSLCISRVQLHRRLKSDIGMSASEMIRWVRISTSAALLKTTDLNVTEVSYEVGFNNLSYFASCFRKQYGMNPSDYRNHIKFS